MLPSWSITHSLRAKETSLKYSLCQFIMFHWLDLDHMHIPKPGKGNIITMITLKKKTDSCPESAEVCQGYAFYVEQGHIAEG